MAGKGRRKTVREASPPTTPKKARPGDTPANEHVDGHPSWRFENADGEFPDGANWSTVSADELRGILETLAHCESLHTSQLFSQRPGNKGHVAEYNNETMDTGLTKDARDRLSDLGLGDLDRIYRIRADGATRRLYAWRGNGNVFNLIWWDPDHVVYPTEPRNT